MAADERRADDAHDPGLAFFCGGVVGCLALGFLASSAVPDGGDAGLFTGGGTGLLVAQTLSVLGVMVYTFVVTWAIAKVIDLAIGFRLPEEVRPTASITSCTSNRPTPSTNSTRRPRPCA